jgi:serpin B
MGRSCPLILLLAVGCGPPVVDGAGGDPGFGHAIIGSERPRDLDPEVTEAELAERVAAQNGLGLEVYQALRAESGGDGFAFAPPAIAAAAARVHAGARRATEAELAAALRFPSEQPPLHAALDRLDLALAGERPGYDYRSVHAVWGQIGLPYRVAFLDLLAESYGADLHLVDLVGQPDDARAAIDGWMAEQTGGAVDSILPPGAFAAAPAVVVTSATTLSALWREEFPRELTHPAPFTRADGTAVTASMMVSQASDCYRYAEGDDYRALELTFLGDQLAMVVVVPDAGRLGAVEDAVDDGWWAALLSGLAPTSLSIALPRFTLASRLRLDALLAALGVEQPFTERADFSGITGNLDLRLGALAHHARVAVDERGLDAATGTLGVSDGEPERLLVDRPFLFLVRDLPTGAILLAGRVTDPTAD